MAMTIICVSVPVSHIVHSIHRDVCNWTQVEFMSMQSSSGGDAFHSTGIRFHCTTPTSRKRWKTMIFVCWFFVVVIDLSVCVNFTLIVGSIESQTHIRCARELHIQTYIGAILSSFIVDADNVGTCSGDCLVIGRCHVDEQQYALHQSAHGMCIINMHV